VSKATASAVLRGTPGPAAQTAAKVRQAARELGYRSRIGARALRTGLNSTVAVVLDPTTMDRRLQVDTFWAKLVNSVVLTCSAEGVPVLLVAAEDSTALAGQAVDAVLFISDDVSVDEFQALGFGLPLVKIDMGDRVDGRLTTVLRLDVDRCVREVTGGGLRSGTVVVHAGGAQLPTLVH
jgi:DNA-binding LacI/PurR family transcriptional regulator